ncbi:DUF481 domain-containing protein [Robertkochia marina]|uniref:DUF481 domain-containing protein n=1 Tax=Robertkochia marina TaxID=1227945 RepID=A0A4S3LYC8_9FLAO|nr:DUF481 domain-containing protein [Robertkochia marina]THD66295.1 DUF481 domain-containing protein [Robertkochia marina]TRZ41216.1 DUF481 domain-containing protein [Robertkochia marina]
MHRQNNRSHHKTYIPHRGLSGFLWVLTFLICFIQGYSQTQNDTIFLKNQDRIIGEIKSLVNGVLKVETDYGKKDFEITWLDVAVIRSTQYYLLTLEDGGRYNGTMRTRERDSSVVTLYTFEGTHTIDLEKIVYLHPIESQVISRFDASISVGFNFTKSNNLQQFSIKGRLAYSARIWAASASINTISNTQEGVESTARTDADIGAMYFLKKDWFVGLNADFLANEEQQLDLRTALKGYIGKYLIHSNRIYLACVGGIGWNNENFSDAENTNRNSLEAVLGSQFNAFDLGDFKVYASLFAYPSLTESNRIRADFKTDLKYDLPKDFFITLGYTLNFDSQPVETAAREDYIFQATFGWELD